MAPLASCEWAGRASALRAVLLMHAVASAVALQQGAAASRAATATLRGHGQEQNDFVAEWGFQGLVTDHVPNRSYLFIGVITAPNKQDRRDEIRQTWLKDPLVSSGVVTVRFFMGNPGESRDAVAKEMNVHGDIVMLDVEEGYDRLTKKTYSFLTWVMKNREEGFVMKLDDDTWPHLWKLVPKLRELEGQYKFALMGHIFPCAPVLHGTKWAEDPAIYNYEFFPTYAQGSGYILTLPLVREMLAEHQSNQPRPRKLLHNEDASVGYWIKMDMLNTPSLKVNYINLYSTLYGCDSRDFLTMNLWSGDMRCMRENKLSGKSNICCVKKGTNNLQVAPSFVQASAPSKRLGCFGSTSIWNAEAEVVGPVQPP